MNDIRRWMTLCETSPLAVKVPDDIDPNVKVVLPTVYRGVEAGTDAQRAIRVFRGGDLGDGVYVTAKEWLAKTYGGGPKASVANRRRVVYPYRLDALFPDDVVYLFGAATGGQPVSLVSGNGIELWRGQWSGQAIERALHGQDIALVIGTPNSIGVNQIAVRNPNLLHPLDTLTETQNPLDAVWMDVDKSGTVTEGIAAAEDAWIGGVANFGDKGAALHIGNMAGYARYAAVLRRSLAHHIGFPLTVYRLMPRDAFEDYMAAPSTDAWAVSFIQRIAESFLKFAATGPGEYVVIRINLAHPEAVIMRGHRSEAEIVINPYEIDMHAQNIAIVKAVRKVR